MSWLTKFEDVSQFPHDDGDTFNWMEVTATTALFLLLFWQAPLIVRSAIHRHQHPQRTDLSHVDCFIQCGVVSCQISLDGVEPGDARAPWRSPPVLRWVKVKVNVDLYRWGSR